MITHSTRYRFLALLAIVGVTTSVGSATAATKAKSKAKTTTAKTTKAKATTTKAATTAATSAATTAATTATTAAAPAAKALKITEIQNGSEPPSWDPLKLRASAGADANRMYPIYGALYYMDPKTKEFTPLFAESFNSADGVNWTLKLKSGIKFSDGSALDAAAIKAHWERIQDPAQAAPSRATALQVATMTVVDPLTLRVVLTTRNQQLLWGIQRTAMLYVPSPKAVAAGTIGTAPAGAGPFVLKDFKRDDKTVMSANPDWPFWPGGKPNIEELTIKPVIDENQRYNNLATGQAQLSFTQFSQILDKAKKDGNTFSQMAQEGGNSILFNTTRPPFDDARIRRALQLAYDPKAYEAVNSNGAEDPITNIFDDDSVFLDKGQNFPKANLDEAQKLVDSYVQENGGKTVDITLGHFTSTANALNAQFFQAQWSRLKGLKVSLDGADSPTAQGRVIRGNFGVHLWGNLFTDPDELYEALTSSSNQNWGRYNNAAMDAALNLGRAGTTVAERKAAYGNVMRIVNFEVPLIWYDRVPTSFIHQKSTSNLVWYYDGVLRVDQVKFAA